MNLYQDKHGGWRMKPSLLTTLRPYAKALAISSLLGLVVIGSHRAVNEARSGIYRESSKPSSENSGFLRNGNKDNEVDCKESKEGSYDCTDEATKAKVYEAAKKGLKWHYQEEKQNTFKASVTKYSRKDSCHNPKGNACLTASGEDTKEGRTVACPRSIKLGTKVLINGKTYTCLDRYAKYLDQKRRLPTFDIFTESYEQAVQWGIREMTVEIL